jgi:hypothetical protein
MIPSGGTQNDAAGATPGNSANDPDYVMGVGLGGRYGYASGNGGDGLVVISF